MFNQDLSTLDGTRVNADVFPLFVLIFRSFVFFCHRGQAHQSLFQDYIPSHYGGLSLSTVFGHEVVS